MSIAKNRKDMTTGQVARLAGCALRTVGRWSDEGLLKGYRVPGSRDRRFRPEVVAEFFAAHGIDREVPGVGDPGPARHEPPRVLFVGFAKEARADFLLDGIVPSFSAAGPFAGMALVNFAPSVVVVDSAGGRIEASQVAAAARSVGAAVVLFGGQLFGKGEFHAWISAPSELPGIVARLAAEKGES